MEGKGPEAPIQGLAFIYQDTANMQQDCVTCIPGRCIFAAAWLTFVFPSFWSAQGFHMYACCANQPRCTAGIGQASSHADQEGTWPLPPYGQKPPMGMPQSSEMPDATFGH